MSVSGSSCFYVEQLFELLAASMAKTAIPFRDSSPEEQAGGPETKGKSVQKQVHQRGPRNVTNKPAAKTTTEGRKRTIERINERSSEDLSPDDGTRSGQGPSKRSKKSDQATVSPPECVAS